MRFRLAGHVHDLTHRALVIGRARTADGARRLIDEGADIVEVADPDAVADLAATVTTPAPIAIDAEWLDDVTASYQAGAVLGSCPDPAFLAASARAGASVITNDPAAALAAGLPHDRIAIDHPHGPFPTVVTTDDYGEMAVAVTYGARLIRTTDVLAARRVADVLAAILEAGDRP